MKRESRRGLFSALVFSISVSVVADEGMWTFDALPTEQLRTRYGFSATPEWIENTQKSLLRISAGGTGSFVSTNGLVITNHHVAQKAIQSVSTPENDYIANGYYARTPGEELRVPNHYIDQLVSITDVTARVQAASNGAANRAEENRLIDAEKERIQIENERTTGLKGEVVTLFRGGAYHLYSYKRYTDIRLVFAPEFKIAFFGGDEDNFEFPRYDLDIAFLRAYENDVPAVTPHFLRFAAQGPVADDLTFIIGNPGSTKRMLTSYALQDEKQNSLKYNLERLRKMLTSLDTFSATSEEAARRASNERFSFSNSLKVTEGKNNLLTERILGLKQEQESGLRAQVAANPTLAPELSAWDDVKKSVQVLKKVREPLNLFESEHAFQSVYFKHARKLLRYTTERVKPEAERLPEYASSQVDKLEKEILSTAPIYADLEIAKLTASLEFLNTKLPRSRLTQRILRGTTPAALAQRVVNGSRLNDVAVRREIFEGGAAALARYATDPAIVLAKQVDAESRAIRKRYEEESKVPGEKAYQRITNVLRSTGGENLYPDATFSPRLSFGAVRGYEQDGVMLAPHTTIGGAFTHEAAHGATGWFRLPDSWHNAQARLHADAYYNFVTTNDIIGGNSGSAVVNRAGEFAGIVFDGNRYGILGDYYYDESNNRAVSVHSDGILESLRVIYQTERVLQELGRAN